MAKAETTRDERPLQVQDPARTPLRIVESVESSDAAQSAATGASACAEIHRRLIRIEQLLELVPLLLAQVVDPTHLPVPAAARVLRVTEKTIRRRITAGSLTLEVIPGTRLSGVPIMQLYDGWINLRTSRQAFERECRGKRS